MPKEMLCQCCKIKDLNEILILRKKNFTHKGKEFSRFNRVCWDCAKMLVKKGLYEIGVSWRWVIYDIARRSL